MNLQINKDTTLCVSLSARPGNFGTRFQNYLFGKMQLNYLYKAFAIQDIQNAIIGIRALGIRGCAISMPFKEICMDYLDEVDSSAVRIGSVNTIVNTKGTLRGYNTDYVAVRYLLQSKLTDRDMSFALAGSGGMAKAVAYALKDSGFNKGQIVSRNAETGRSLADSLGFSWDQKVVGKPRLIINATPIGMSGTREESQTPFDDEIISKADTIFDVVAIPIETPLIRKAHEEGKNTINGFEVITLQAVEQFYLYTGHRPDPELLREAALFAKS